MRVVVALGGNAILPAGPPRGTAEEQRATIAVAAGGLAGLIAAGHELVVTHGNGPQVGRLMVQQRAAEIEVVPLPLDVLGAQTQGALGYLVQQQLGPALRAAGVSRTVATVVTQVVADPGDPAFDRPDKPVGPHYTEAELEVLAARAGTVLAGPPPKDLTIDGARYRRAGATWRRVVASPVPLEVVELPAVQALLAAGVVPVCAGGGGAPVARRGDAVEGLEAVIDKDRTAALLARLLDADALLILTDVDRVVLGFGTDDARPLDRLTAAEARRHLADGTFPAGSMGPKVAAAIEVAEAGLIAVITSLDQAGDALAGRAGTRVVR